MAEVIVLLIFAAVISLALAVGCVLEWLVMRYYERYRREDNEDREADGLTPGNPRGDRRGRP